MQTVLGGEPRLNAVRPTWGSRCPLCTVQHPGEGARVESIPNIMKGIKSGLDELLKTKGRNKKDVKNEDRSAWIIENKGRKKVVWMS